MWLRRRREARGCLRWNCSTATVPVLLALAIHPNTKLYTLFKTDVRTAFIDADNNERRRRRARETATRVTTRYAGQDSCDSRVEAAARLVWLTKFAESQAEHLAWPVPQETCHRP